MKIALINKFYPPVIGGIEYHVRSLAENLVKLDDIEIVKIVVANETNRCSNEQIGEKIFIYKLPNWKTIASTPIVPEYISFFKQLDVDIVHFHFPYPFADFAWLLANVNKPFIITYHSDIIRQRWLNKLYSPIRDKFFSAADKILATSPQLITNSKVLNKFKNKTVLVPLGINPYRFLEKKGIEEGCKIREMYGNSPIVLFVGRLVYYKGVEILINAFKNIDAKLVMIGHGKLKSKLENMVKAYGIGKKVFFFDSIDDDILTAYFHACDIFVLPSVAATEAYGLVQLEAQVCGKPVISTNLPTGVPYVNKHDYTGIVVEPNNVVQLESAINLLLKNVKLRNQMGKQAKTRVLQEFTDSKMTERVFNIYRNVIYNYKNGIH